MNSVEVDSTIKAAYYLRWNVPAAVSGGVKTSHNRRSSGLCLLLELMTDKGG
jgi:hypothetical protein